MSLNPSKKFVLTALVSSFLLMSNEQSFAQQKIDCDKFEMDRSMLSAPLNENDLEQLKKFTDAEPSEERLRSGAWRFYKLTTDAVTDTPHYLNMIKAVSKHGCITGFISYSGRIGIETLDSFDFRSFEKVMKLAGVRYSKESLERFIEVWGGNSGDVPSNAER